MERLKDKKAIACFSFEHVLFWSNLSRLNGLLIILNISMFFLTGLVAKESYYTFYAMVGLGLVGVGMLVPTDLVRNVKYDGVVKTLHLLRCCKFHYHYDVL